MIILYMYGYERVWDLKIKKKHYHEIPIFYQDVYRWRKA